LKHEFHKAFKNLAHNSGKLTVNITMTSDKDIYEKYIKLFWESYETFEYMRTKCRYFYMLKKMAQRHVSKGYSEEYLIWSLKYFL
jgi:hypothetical protein